MSAIESDPAGPVDCQPDCAGAAVTPVRIQRKRTKGWRMPEGAVYVGRPTKWGNPFNVKSDWLVWAGLAYGYKGSLEGRRAAAVAFYRSWITGQPAQAQPAPKQWNGAIGFTDTNGKYFEVTSDQYLRSLGGRFATLYPPPVFPDIPSLEELRGKNLACFCPLDQPCHADVLLELANAEPKP